MRNSSLHPACGMWDGSIQTRANNGALLRSYNITTLLVAIYTVTLFWASGTSECIWLLRRWCDLGRGRPGPRNNKAGEGLLAGGACMQMQVRCGRQVAPSWWEKFLLRPGKAPSSSLSFLHYYYYYSTAASTRNTAHPWQHRWARHVTLLSQAHHASAHVHPAWTGPGAVEQIRPSLLQLYASVPLQFHPSQSALIRTLPSRQ
jgi:hypothetical protein